MDNSQVSPEDLNRIAARVAELRLEPLAQFLVESHLPLSTLFYNLSICVEPFATPFVGNKRFQSLQALLKDRSKLEQLVELMDRKAKPKAKQQVPH